ncbi:hypothetical protein [Intestinirhabdus alba]|jgi:hypothetical protein|uniref:Adhesin n=1 Tax=Intestinirhabdus alba TaxID=2899544 RepID=A0A6L6IU79_9ENTR|nr:hypothetical protein [Intestinirhabdus alba]MTH48293.1 hypothetical protein [Intestinirhabdus alba]
MKYNKILNKFPFFMLALILSSKSSANNIPNPQFSDYQVPVSQGPFEEKLHLTKLQGKYSLYWKNKTQEQLTRSVNFAGHYRIYTIFGGHGEECKNDNWVCGWVLDKQTGKVVATLPADDNGSSIYADIADNGTPTGLPFQMDAFKNSSMIAITGQSIPAMNKTEEAPVCKTVIFNFNGNKYIRLIESLAGCD